MPAASIQATGTPPANPVSINLGHDANLTKSQAVRPCADEHRRIKHAATSTAPLFENHCLPLIEFNTNRKSRADSLYKGSLYY
jgi:hypothetical protein